MHFVTAQQNEQLSYMNDQFSEKLSIQLYPNPYKGGKLLILTRPTEIKEIMILNILGEVVFQTTTPVVVPRPSSAYVIPHTYVIYPTLDTCHNHAYVIYPTHM